MQALKDIYLKSSDMIKMEDYRVKTNLYNIIELGCL